MMCVGCITAANAQSSFTQRLQQSKNGEGKITVTHSQNIDFLVNGKTAAVQKDSSKVVVTTEEAKALIKNSATRDSSYRSDIIDQTTVVDTSKKVMRGGQKVNGWRVQVYAGGNQRTDRQKAERIGNEIKAQFNNVPVYVHFYSPRGICRVGNFRTYEEAHQMLIGLRKMGFSQATIVKGKITVHIPIVFPRCRLGSKTHRGRTAGF